ncbi:MAG: alanine racemase [Candidatus Babeliales bacterium]
MTIATQNIQSTTSITQQSQNHRPSSWVEINSQALAHNIRMYKQIIGNALLAPVIKSNAYGHGIEQIAHLCNNNPDVDMLCTVSLFEALLLRSRGISKPLLVLSIIDAPLEDAVTHNIELVVYDIETAHALNEYAQRYNTRARVHIKIDTGLSRLGIIAEHALEFITSIHTLPHIIITGIFTHLSESEKADQTFTNYQLERFEQLLQHLAAQDISIPLIHTTCSAATTANIKSHNTLVRLGIGMYGLWPSAENKQITHVQYPNFTLQPVLTWKTRIIQIKEAPAGSFVGYDRTHKTEHITRIATLPIGYWDGYDRKLSNKGCVYIQGRRVPILGRIAMNLMMVDVTGISVQVGDEVTLLGNYPCITADKLAEQCATIHYEMVTRINPLLLRIIK